MSKAALKRASEAEKLCETDGVGCEAWAYYARPLLRKLAADVRKALEKQDQYEALAERTRGYLDNQEKYGVEVTEQRDALKRALALHRSMVLSGEQCTEQSEAIFHEAMGTKK
tara:strand:- start:131 stop:469 length:339 start_codon:yes stop_codon:yes gene_type:complete